MCEIHGPDINVSTMMIGAQFIASDKENEKSPLLNLNLTKNQFLRLFPKKSLEKLVPIQHLYNIKISDFNSNANLEELVVDFIDLLEFDDFMGLKRLKENTITKSGITINFLFDYQFTNEKNCKFTFSAIALRSLKSYIEWRYKQFRADIINIEKSLLSTRADVVNSSNEKLTIRNININSKQQITSIDFLEKELDEVKINLNELYHDNNHFFLSSRIESKIYSALNNFSRSMLKSLKKYCITNSCLVEIEKVKFDDVTYFNKLIGKAIKNSIDLANYITQN